MPIFAAPFAFVSALLRSLEESAVETSTVHGQASDGGQIRQLLPEVQRPAGYTPKRRWRPAAWSE